MILFYLQVFRDHHVVLGVLWFLELREHLGCPVVTDTEWPMGKQETNEYLGFLKIFRKKNVTRTIGPGGPCCPCGPIFPGKPYRKKLSLFFMKQVKINTMSNLSIVKVIVHTNMYSFTLFSFCPLADAI